MMQSMRRCLLECYKLNASLILLTLILHDRFFTALCITVNPLESLVSSSTSIESSEYDAAGTGFASEVHDPNNIDNYRFGHGYRYGKFGGGSHEIADTSTTYVFGTSVGGFQQQTIVKQPIIGENHSDVFGEFMKTYSIPIHHSAFELPVAVRPRIVRLPAPSPITAITDGIKDKLKAIYPGTLWCGDGTAAKSRDEVGLFRNTDICCKQHDECPAFIKSGSEFKGLRNTGLFTRSHCDCDMKFYNCLKRTDSLISNKIGYTYFNILRPQCFRKEYPIVGCKKWVNKKCYVYMVDDQQTPAWQWFENKLF